MNVELLKRIKRRILRSPEKFRMDDWNCGTAMCIGGWACALTGAKFDPKDLSCVIASNGRRRGVARVARVALRVSKRQAETLFYVRSDLWMGTAGWPERFTERFRRARLRKERAKIAAERIDHFIATGE